ncbi:MAG: FAD-dependent oxidoreductase [Alphaproteobacteria bacterium]
MKSHARVVVIGGGIVGCSVLYHLTKLGWSDVVLVEKTELTAGSTWHAAGNLPFFSLGVNLTRLHAYSVKLYQELEAETGQSVGFHKTGSLRLATTPDRMDEYRYHQGKARWLGIPYEILGREEVNRLYPLVSTKGLLGVVYNPDDGHIDPSSVTQALATAARQRGAEIYRPAPVTDLVARPDGGWDVVTEQATITAELVVLAAGFWSPAIARLAGVDLPIMPVQHQYVVTDAIPEVEALDFELPVLRDVDASYYLRQEGQGLLVGPYETAATPWATAGIPPDFGQELLPPDLERIEPYLLAAMARVPVLEKGGIKRVVNGPISYGPDGSALVGPVPGLKNFWVAAGFSFGIIQAGGAGHHLAQWIVEGEPELDLFDLDPARFGDFATKAYVLAKVRETYANEYAVVYPFEERPAGRPAKISPVYTRLAQRGAVFGARYGWERANWFAPDGVEREDRPSFRRTNWFESVGQECRAVREGVGILDLTSFSKFEVRGPGAEAFLDRLCANRLPRRTGRIALSQVLTPKGRILSDLTITRLGADCFYVVSGAASERHDLRWFEEHRPKNGVTIDNITGRYGCLVLAGPRSRALLDKLTDADLANDAFPFLSCREITVGPAPVRALRISYEGELGWELHHPVEYTMALYEALLAAGEDLGVVDFGLRAMDSLRLEKAYRLWGMDITKEDTPLEARLDRFVKFDKEDFIGREALLRQAQEGVGRCLAYLTVDAAGADPVGNEPVFERDRVVGYVTSGGFGHVVEQSIAFAYVPPELAEPGTALEVEILGDRRAMTVVEAPLYDPENAKLKA